MFPTRIPKSQQPEKSLYVIHDPHDPGYHRDWSDEPYLKFVSIDPGRTNFAIRVSLRPQKVGKIVPLLFDRVNFNDLITDDEVGTSRLYTEITAWLDRERGRLESPHVVIIERQLPINYRTVRVSQHVLTYFLIACRNNAVRTLIFEVSPCLKGRMLGVPRGINEKQLKAWTVTTARAILTRREETSSLAILDQERKQDDLADTIVQEEALCKYLGWASG